MIEYRKILCDEDHNTFCFRSKIPFEEYFRHLTTTHRYQAITLEDNMPMASAVMRLNHGAGAQCS